MGTPMDREELDARRRGATIWSFVMTGGQSVLRIVMQLILAALLGPEAFGLLALALVYVMLVQILLDQGMGTAIIQRQNLEPSHLDSGFWMLIALSGLLTVGAVAGAGLWAEFQREPDLERIVIVLSLLIPFRALTVVQEAVLKRELDYRSLAIRGNLALVVSGTVGITAALLDAGVWALVYEQLANALVELMVLWSVSSWRPRFRFSTRHAKDLLSFSAGTFLGAAGVFALTRGEALVVGRFFGTTSVGLYRFAWRIVYSMIELVINPLQNVAFSVLSRLQDDREAFAESLLGTLRTASIMLIPVMGIVAGAGPDLLSLVGEEWEPATPALLLLCVYGVASVATLVVPPTLSALGHPFRLAGYVWAIAIIALSALTVAGFALEDDTVERQLIAIAATNVGVFAVVGGIAGLVVVSRHTGIGVGRLLSPMGRPLVAGLAAFGAVLGANALAVADLDEPLVRFLITGTIGTLVAGAALLAVDPEARGFVAGGLEKVRGRPMEAG
ncbi:MAG: lipopolysaccharide biosynthesis protein [Actinomycetota bacterium]